MSDRAVVRQNVAPMRAAPDARSEQTSQAIFGETVRILERDGEFSRVETPDSYQGWVRISHLHLLVPGAAYPDPTRAALTSLLFLPLFREPSRLSERLTLLTLGTAVELLDTESRDYYPIRFPDGEVGYVEQAGLIVPTYPPVERLGPNLVVVARGLLGIPYLWGGRTSFGMDCSGFVQRVYWLCGHTIPRDAYRQVESGLFETVDSPAPGDLLFFAGKDDPHNRKITHVGMAIGDGRFIHASGALGIAATPIGESPYAGQLCAIRRLISKQAHFRVETTGS